MKSTKINLILFAVFFSVFLTTYFFWNSVCGADCGYEVRNGLLRPLHQATVFLSIIFGFFLFLPPKFFQRWLLHIASWALPVSIVAIMSININQSYVIGITRADVAQWLGFALVVISAIHGLVFWVLDKRSQ